MPSGTSYSKADVQGCTQHGKPKSHLSIPLPKKIPRNFAATQVAGVCLSGAHSVKYMDLVHENEVDNPPK